MTYQTAGIRAADRMGIGANGTTDVGVENRLDRDGKTTADISRLDRARRRIWARSEDGGALDPLAKRMAF